MDNRSIPVPVSLLLDPGQTASMKVVGMALRLHPTASPAELEAQTGLSRHTVLRGLAQRPSRGPRVQVPTALLAERAVGAQAKVLYGLLQATPTFRGQSGEFTYASLCSLTKLGRNTLKRAITQLVGAGWVQITQASRLSPIHFTLGSPERRRSQKNRRLTGVLYDIVERTALIQSMSESEGMESARQAPVALLVGPGRPSTSLGPVATP